MARVNGEDRMAKALGWLVAGVLGGLVTGFLVGLARPRPRALQPEAARGLPHPAERG